MQKLAFQETNNCRKIKSPQSGDSRNEQTKDSDIDIAVIFNGFSGDWLKASGDLWRMTEKADTIIEPVLLDIQNDPSGFVEEVLRTGIEV